MTPYIHISTATTILNFEEPLNPELFPIGSSPADYINEKWIPLSEEQVAFARSNPYSSAEEIINCALHTPTLDELRTIKLAELDAYDASPAVNSFTLGGESLWIDNATRVSVTDSITKEKAQGRQTTTLWLGLRRFDLPIDIALLMLQIVEIYAKDCYNTTAQHRFNILALSDTEAIRAYDFTLGYPSHPNLDALCSDAE